MDNHFAIKERLLDSLHAPQVDFTYAIRRDLIIAKGTYTAKFNMDAILRADTAAVAALTLWQSSLGDWR